MHLPMCILIYLCMDGEALVKGNLDGNQEKVVVKAEREKSNKSNKET